MRFHRLWTPVTLLAVLALASAGCAIAQADQDDAKTKNSSRVSTLKRVQHRGQVICGVADTIHGFGYRESDGTYKGFDIDYCKALATAVLGNPAKVRYVALPPEDRLPAVKEGRVDVLIRNTTWTAGRDGTDQATFLTPNFYDGQGMMVHADSNYTRLEDMAGATTCVVQGTTNVDNLLAEFEKRGINHNPRVLQDVPTLRTEFEAGRCDGWTSDKSQLAGYRATWSADEGGPEAVRILDETFSKEPLAPAVKDNDSRWAQVVDWTVLVTIQAEEFGITSQNVDQVLSTSTDPKIKAFLGLTDYDPGLGVPKGFAAKVIRAVGNYAEIYERNVGPSTPLGIERGLNELWTEGGLHYAPPFG